MLGDIVEETNGDLVIAFRDRFADQMGFAAFVQNVDGVYFNGGEPAAGGDLIRGCARADGTFVLDPNLTGGDVLAPGALCTDNNTPGSNSGSQARTFREFYTGEWRTAYHEETVYGGIALSRVEADLVGAGLDPTGEAWTQGVSAVSRAGGLPSGVLGVRMDDATADRYGHGQQIADVEVLCAAAPLQLGGRAWIDADGDGVADAGERPAAGLTVELYDASRTLLATTTTGEFGDYAFDDGNVPAGIAAATGYLVRFGEPGDYAPGGVLEDLVPSAVDAELAVTTGAAGANDLRLDLGFTPPASPPGPSRPAEIAATGTTASAALGLAGALLAAGLAALGATAWLRRRRA